MLVYVYAFESIIIIITVEIVESVIVQLIFIGVYFQFSPVQYLQFGGSRGLMDRELD